MNQLLGPFKVFNTQNNADNHSPEILKLHNQLQNSGVTQPTVNSEHAAVAYVQNTIMPTLQKMHRITAASPRSTAKFFLLMEELSYRHL